MPIKIYVPSHETFDLLVGVSPMEFNWLLKYSGVTSKTFATETISKQYLLTIDKINKRRSVHFSRDIEPKYIHCLAIVISFDLLRQLRNQYQKINNSSSN